MHCAVALLSLLAVLYLLLHACAWSVHPRTDAKTSLLTRASCKYHLIVTAPLHPGIFAQVVLADSLVYHDDPRCSPETVEVRRLAGW